MMELLNITILFMKTFTDNTLERFGNDYFSGRTIYDIGCHDFKETKKFLGLGVKVVGLDKCIYADNLEGIRFIQEDFLQWKPNETVDILNLANVVLFMESGKAFHKISELNPNMIMVQTMYDYPEPNWP